MKLFSRRALASLVVALSFVAGAASPANAYQIGDSSAGSSTVGAWGAGYLDGLVDGVQTWLRNSGEVTKYQLGNSSDAYTCAETWVDYSLANHRAPDLYVNCRGGTSSRGHYFGQDYMYVSTASGPSTSAKWSLSGLQDNEPGTMVCRVDARLITGGFYRNDDPNDGPVNCWGSGVDMSAYTGMDYTWLKGLNNWNEPVRFDTNISDIAYLWGPDNLHKRNSLISENGRYHAFMQNDGNFVVYDVYDSYQVCFATATYGGNPGDHLEITSGGNVKVVNSGGSTLWQSNTSGATGVNPYNLNMGNDGDLMLDDLSGNLIWHTNTSSC